MKNHVNIPDTLYPQPIVSLLVITSRLPGRGVLTQYILDALFVMSPIQKSLRLFCDCAANALVGTILVKLLDTVPLKYIGSPEGHNWVITARSVEKLPDESEGAGGPCGASGVGICCPCSPEEDA